MSKTQRRKGTAKTASSARAAQLLAESGHDVPFISFTNFGFTTAGSSASVETSSDELDVEVRNALKKMRKKDNLTREKGLKELLSRLRQLEFGKIKSSFMHYTTLFPLLIMDSIPSIRTMSLQVLFEYVKMLKKASEKYLKNVLPYVFFALSDTYTSVSDNAQLLLNNFSSQNKALEICCNSCIEMALNILNGTHPYLEKNEGDETDMQRASRITAQALNFLARLVQQQAIREEYSQQIIDLVQSKSLVRRLLDQSPQVASGLFALINQMCSSKWPNVIQKELLVAALTKLDSPNVHLCRFAAEFVLFAFSARNAGDSVLFDEKFLNKTMLPKIISFIKRKGSHWSNVGSQHLVALLKVVLANAPIVSRDELFLKILDTFFDGLIRFDASFDVDVWYTCLNAFISLLSTTIFNDDKKLHIEDVLEVILNNLTKLDDEAPIQLLNKLVAIFRTFCVMPNVHSDKALVLWRRFLLYFIEGLPHTETAIINILEAQTKTVWLQLCIMLVRHTECTSELLVRIVEKFDDNQLLLGLDKQIPLMDELVTRIDWRNETLALRVLAALIKLFVIKSLSGNICIDFQKYFELNNRLACLRLIEAAQFVPVYRRKLFSLAPLHIWEWAIENALQKSCMESRNVFLCVFQVALDHPNAEMLILKFLREFSVEDFDLLLEMARLLAEKDYQNANENISKLMLESLVCLPENNVEDAVSKCAEELKRLKYDAELIVQFIRDQLGNNENRAVLFSILLSLVLQLGSTFGLMLLVTRDELISSLYGFDENFSVDVLMTNEFLSGNWEYSIKDVKDQLLTLKDIVVYAINRSLFLLQYMESFSFTTVKDADDYYPSLLFAVAVNSLPLDRTAANCSDFESYKELNEKVNRLILLDEQLRQRLLERFVKMSKENLPLTMLRALRVLSAGLDVQPYLKSMDPSNQTETRITYSYAAALRAKCFMIPQQANSWSNLSTASEWAWNAELVVSLQDLEIATQFLEAFILSARNKFEEILFVLQEVDDKVECNILSCAMLRLLAFCSQFIDSVSDKCRDFICCGLVTALESCKEVVSSNTVEIPQLFALFAVKAFISCAAIYNTMVARESSFTVFLEEWKSFFCEPAEKIILCWFVSLSDIVGTTIYNSYCSNWADASNNFLVFCYYISRAVHFCSLSAFETISLKQKCDIELDCLNYPIKLQSQIIPLLPLLTSPYCYIQFASLRLFKPIMKEMLLFENKLMDHTDDSEAITEEVQLKMPTVCLRLLKDVHSDGVEPSFLILDALVYCLGDFEPIERVPYCHMLLPYLNNMLPRLFDELPANPEASRKKNLYVRANKTFADLIGVTCDDLLFTKESSLSKMVSKYCFGLFFRTLITVPALVRQWYTSLPRPVSTVVNSYTSEFVSPLVWKTECDKLLSHEFPSTMKVRLRSGGSVREILALFEHDDSTITLRVELPSNYPLTVPIIESEKCIVNRETRRKWILQLTMCISHQNGSIADAIALWARNVQKHLEGAEDCTICMCIVNPTTYQLPKVKCKHCKKKFHSDCIRKWLESSSQATCPLCRSMFT